MWYAAEGMSVKSVRIGEIRRKKRSETEGRERKEIGMYDCKRWWWYVRRKIIGMSVKISVGSRGQE